MMICAWHVQIEEISLPDQDGYPTEEELTICKTGEDFDKLLDYVQDIWWASDHLITEELYEWQISTGGWSGNEDIIYNLKKNTMFWMFCWVQSRRGGHYIFQTPQQRKEEDEADNK